MRNDGSQLKQQTVRCSQSSESRPDRTETQFYPASSAKQLGRTAFHADTGTLWCYHAGTGIAFTAYGERCRITLLADTSHCCLVCAAHYAVYVNGRLFVESLLRVRQKVLDLSIAPEGTQIRIVKLSESALSGLGIGLIRVGASSRTIRVQQGRLLIPTPHEKLLIEFIGDSITCGYGVNGICGTGSFSTWTEHAEKAFAILTAKQLHADYSLVCFSGYGVCSGYTADGNYHPSEIVPPLYDKMGFSIAKLENGRSIQNEHWNFRRQPDLIVINLGTNDAAYTGNDPEKQAQFADAYRAFLKTVRRNNPDAHLLCMLGTMGQTLCTAVSEAVRAYTAETGDSDIRFLAAAEQQEADGFGIDWHPSAATHEKAAAVLSDYIRTWLEI